MQVIDRDTLTRKAETLYQHTPSGKIIPWSAVRVCAINNIKTIDAEPVRHGKWVRHKPNGIIWTLKCSECGWIDNRITLNAKFNYCPNCGAKMDGGK